MILIVRTHQGTTATCDEHGELDHVTGFKSAKRRVDFHRDEENCLERLGSVIEWLPTKHQPDLFYTSWCEHRCQIPRSDTLEEAIGKAREHTDIATEAAAAEGWRQAKLIMALARQRHDERLYAGAV